MKRKIKKTYTREDLLEIFHRLQDVMRIEGYSRVLDVKEEFGFNRYD
jgi:hypothetical protein